MILDRIATRLVHLIVIGLAIGGIVGIVFTTGLLTYRALEWLIG